MDQYNDAEYQWPDQVESHELNERAPINYNQNTYMTTNVRDTSVESLNIDSMQVKGNGHQIAGEVRRRHHDEVPLEGGFAMIWKYSEQLKSISAGLLLFMCSGMHTVWAIYQVLFYSTSHLYKHDLEQLSASNETEATTEATVSSMTTASTIANHTHHANKTIILSAKTTAATAAVGDVIISTIASNAHHEDHLKKVNSFFKIMMISEYHELWLTIAFWFVGVMLGCYVAGWFLVRVVQKRNIYYVAALVMFASGCVFYSADVAQYGWQYILMVGRLLAGLSHGITYVTVFVQASENASKDFRRTVVTTIGITLGLSIFIASAFLIYIPIPTNQLIEGSDNVVESSEVLSAGIISTVTVILCFFSVVFNYFFSHETVPFMLYHNFREEDAQFALAKLLGEDRNAPLVRQEFDSIRELCHDDYAEFPEGKIFTRIHRGLLAIPLSSRITSAVCLTVLWIVFTVKVIEYMMREEFNEIEDDHAKLNVTELVEKLEIIVKLSKMHSVAVRAVIATWFIAGLQVALVGNYFNWKRGFHFTTFVVGAAIIFNFVFYWIGFLTGLFFVLSVILLSIYIHFLLLPIDILGYGYLTECFPISTKAKSIAFVTICECLFNLIIISFELRHDKPNFESFVVGLLFFILGYKLYSTVPNTLGLSLGAAKHAYVQAIVGKKWWQP